METVALAGGQDFAVSGVGGGEGGWAVIRSLEEMLLSLPDMSLCRVTGWDGEKTKKRGPGSARGGVGRETHTVSFPSPGNLLS